MQTLTIDAAASRVPGWLRAASLLGVLWNAYGLHQFAGTFTVTGRAAMTAGMTAAQADVYLGLPAWISIAFAIGVVGGLVGSITLALRRWLAGPVLAASLGGYIVLFAGDTWHGVFAALPGQLAILALVVLMAAGLFAAARIADRRGLLR